MRAPGVDVRPLRQMNGDAHFTEVFLDDVRVPDADRIGAAGEGWRVALTCLSLRTGRGDRRRRAAACSTSTGSIALARDARPRSTTRSVRDALARLVIELRVMALHRAPGARHRARAAGPGPEGSGLKLRGSRMFRDYTDARACASSARRARSATASWQTLFLTAPSLSIRGGTDEIQRNIVGERVLGLPEEPRVDRDLPFESLPRSGR